MGKITGEIAQKWLADVPEDKPFWCHDGRKLKNLVDLEIALREIDDNIFRYHANEQKNDFSKWVREVIGDEKLSRDLEKSRDRIQAAGFVARRVQFLRSRLEQH